MANHIQSTVRLIHSVQQPKPTKDNKPTTANAGVDANKTTTPNIKPEKTSEEEVKDGVERIVGITSMKRRAFNIAAKEVVAFVNRQYDKNIFTKNLMGNTRGANKTQQSKQIHNSVAQLATSGGGAVITSVALTNPYIALIWLGGQALEMGNKLLSFQQDVFQYQVNREKDIFESAMSNQRLNQGMYRRR